MKRLLLLWMVAGVLGLSACSDDTASESTTVTCQVQEHLVDGVCTACPLGSINGAGDDPSDGNTACVPVYCIANNRVESNACVPCPTGISNEAGDDASGADTQCESALCAADEFVRDSVCLPCENGGLNLPGDDANGADTICDGDLCPSNQFVVSNLCLPCPDGTINEPGDDALGADTACDAILCQADEYVSSNSCMACDVGTTNAAGDVASGGDTTCDAAGAVCAFNEYVSSNVCTACPSGTIHPAGDDPAGADTVCEVADACALVLGVQCPDFEQAYLKASNTDPNDRFGQAIALDGNTLAVGAWVEASSATGINGDQTNNDATNSGAVYVFTRNGTTWAQQAYIKASNTGSGDYFGYALALSGKTLVVGARGESSDSTGVGGAQDNDNALTSGAVYVYRRTGMTWAQEAYLKASNAEAGDRFGASVGLDGNNLVVGASYERSNASGVNGDQTNNAFQGAGAAYVFTRTGSAWAQQAYLKASNPDSADYFGTTVAIQGDTVVIGAPEEDSSSTGINSTPNKLAPISGAAYVFTRSGTTWSQQAYLKGSNTGGDDNFGASLAIDGDTLAVGAWGEDSNADGVGGDQADNSVFQSGAVYLFVRANGIWAQQAYLKASNPDEYAYFGHSVALQGDLLVVGAWGESSAAIGLNGDEADRTLSNAGAVYLFRRAVIWSQQAYLKASNTGLDDYFGYALGLDNGTLAVSATLENSNATGVNGDQTNNDASLAGAVYVRLIAP
jgi:hypothetical protein